MSNVRRSRHVFVHFRGRSFLDLAQLLRGRIDITPGQGDEIVAVSLLTGSEHLLTVDSLGVLAAVPATRWVPREEAAAGASPEALLALAAKGLLLTDDPEPEAARMREREQALSSMPWDDFAALYHYLSRWRDIETLPADTGSEEVVFQDFSELVGRHGPPPAEFHELADAAQRIEIPPGERQGPLYDLLRRRRTARSFDAATPLPLDHLATLLRYVFGCHGTVPLGGGATALKKTSPSGGSLHPTEVYPLVLNVAGLDPGLYHYRVRDHSLEPVRRLVEKDARELAVRFTAGQVWFGSAHAMFVMTARFRRNFWKYRQHRKAYKVLWMDVAHLSQTLYLVCADLGLGAFFTGAINDGNIEEALGIDGLEEGALAVCGCGIPSAGRDPLAPEFRPYVPAERRT